MDVFEGGEVGLLVLGFKVNDLAADHAFDGAGGVGNFADDRDARLGWTGDLCEHFVGLRLQPVSGEDGDGFAEGLVACGTSAAQIVVVKRGQIVVDQGIGVEHFERGADLLDAGGQRSSRGVAGLCPAETGQSPVTTQCRSDHAPRFHAEDWPQALSAGKHAVPHGLMDGSWMLGGRRQESIKGSVGGFASLLQNLFQHGTAV